MVATPDLGSGAERRGGSSPFIRTDAKIAQLVEHNLAKVGVAGSNPVFRSSSLALVVELVDTQDLKSCVRKDVRVQVPSGVQKTLLIIWFSAFFLGHFSIRRVNYEF